MEKSKPAEPGPADTADQPATDRNPARTKDRQRERSQPDDQPGADGPSSAGANEDTYD